LQTGDNVEQGKGSALLLRSARAKRSFWIEQRDAALTARDRDAEATAQRFIQEYDQFISLLTGHIGAT
jgi:hypothetical protein